MSLLLALQGGAPAITGTVVQAATKGQHLAQGVESFLAAGVQGANKGQSLAVGLETFSGTGVQRGMAAPHVAVGAETFSATVVQRGQSAPTVAEGVEGFVGNGVQVGGVGTFVAVGEVVAPAPIEVVVPGMGSGRSRSLSLPDVWVDPPYAPLAVTGAGAGRASAGRTKSTGMVRNPSKSPVLRAPFPPLDTPEVKQVVWRSWGDLGTQQDDEEAVLLALLD